MFISLKQIQKIFDLKLNLEILAIISIGITVFSVLFIPEGFFTSRPENFILPFAIISLLFADWKQTRISGYGILILLFFLSTVISCMINFENFYGVDYSFRIFKFFLLFLVTVKYAWNNIKKLEDLFRIITWLLVLINFLQILNPLEIGNLISSFYTHHSHFIELNQKIGRTFRLIGTMVNPNDNAFLWMTLAAFFMSIYYYKRRKDDLFLLLISVFFILLTQSRTIFFAILLMGAVFFLFFKIKKITFMYAFILITSTLFFVEYMNLGYLSQALSQNPIEVRTFRMRFEIWVKMIDLWQEKIIFGWGAFSDFKKVFNGSPDSEYFYILVSYGLTGILFYITILLYPIMVFYDKCKRNLHGILSVLLPLGLLLVAITNMAILNVRVGMLCFILLGISFSFYLNNNQKPEEFNK